MSRRVSSVVLKALGAIIGTCHGLLGLLGLVLYRTGPEDWTMLVISLALVSTPAALTVGVWGGHRIAAIWLGGAALVLAVTGQHEYSVWWYASLFYGPQLVSSLLLVRRDAVTMLGLKMPVEDAAEPPH
jgi:hypothetical protein